LAEDEEEGAREGGEVLLEKDRGAVGQVLFFSPRIVYYAEFSHLLHLVQDVVLGFVYLLTDVVDFVYPI